MPLPVLQCQEPTPPPGMECNTTRIFGAPIGTPGRNNVAIGGIAIHGIKDTYEGYLAKACLGSTKIAINCHASFHYVLDAETGQVTSLVPEANLAWAFQSYRTNFPVTTPVDGCPCPPPCPTPPCPTPAAPTTYPGWSVLSALHPNLAADFFSINIGITVPSRPELTALDGVNCCIGPYGLSPVAYEKLIRLLAWIQSRYPAILLNAQHIAVHDTITLTEEGCEEFPCGPNGACLTCDVSNYCEQCQDRAAPLAIEDDQTVIRYIYAETTGGCRVKIDLATLTAFLEG